MESFLLKILKKIRKDAPRRLKDLRDLCDEHIDSLAENEKDANLTVHDTDADKYFEPFRMTCESGLPRLIDIALGGIHFLLEHGYLRGKRRISHGTIAKDEHGDASDEKAERRTMMDLVIETICKCSDEFDEGVQLQVIKALLVAVTSTHCEVHEASLLLSVRACFHIHLISKNQVNKTTAKAALTQMLSVINQRMENFDLRAKAETAAALSALSAAGSDLAEHNIMILTDDFNAEAQTANDDDSSAPSATDSRCQEEGVNDKPDSLTNNVVQEEVGKSISPPAVSADPAALSAGTGGMIFPSIAHKDSFLIFRALCKLSMKGLHDNDESGAISDPIALQNKILSLELILHTLRTCGPAFRTGEKFIYAIRNYLCVSLLSNCTSQVAQVVGLSLQIFAALMEGFKDHLKSELEVFVATIFLRILESENSTYDHKLRVLEVFHGICKDPSVQVEMFINYDCEMDSIDLFRRIVDGFAKIAKNPVLSHARGNTDFMSSSSKRLGTEEQNIRLMGLKGVTIVLESLMRSSGLWQGLSNDPESDQPPLPTALDRAIASGSLTALDVSVSGRHPDIPSDQDNGANAAAPTGDLATTASSTKNSSVVNVFDRKQKVQEEVETGILKFNLSPKKGLQYLASLGHVEMTPKGVATFLLTYQDRLDKTSIGDYLGREREYENGFCLKVLHEYVDSMDFENMAFDLAIRYFLSGFRLPGEAQKIDRLMEKFAERYYLQNRDTFASADMAFILAFSTIMLQTNLHNPAIRDDKRMTKEQFLKQNKGISADGELSDDLLSEIYDRIAAAPISITEDEKLARKVKKEEPASFTVFQVSNDKRRKDAFNHERKEMVRTGEAMFRQALKKGTVFVRNTTRNEEACSKPMFEVVWPPMIGVLSQLLELADEPQLMEQCLLGFHYMIRLACRLDFPTARHALCNALAKFTTLETVREMHRKNVECTKLLLQIARTEADYLEENWTQVLQCVSQLARLQLFANRLHTDDVFFSDTSSHSQAERSRHGRPGSSAAGSGFGGFHWQSSGEKPPSAMDPFTKLFAGPSRADTVRQIEENNAELLMREIDPQLVDQIFLGSSSLNSESVYFFVKSLCEVSALEISVSSSMNSLRGKDSSVDTANPRIFSLQKLVEVADANMQCRSRYAWGKIWSLLANHFTVVGTQDNFALAMFAIDSLKQLSTKFLQKQELSNFNFQRVFLKPFEVIISKSKSHEIKDLVLRCIDVLLRTSSANIRSGWRSIFAIFEVAAAQDATEVATIAFEITQRLLMSQFQLLIYDFVELVNCLVTFVSSTHTSLSVKALGLLSVCADHLASGALGPALEGHPNHPDQQTSASPIDTNGEHPNKGGVEVDGKIDEDASVFRLWWPLLFGLSSHVADVRPQVRERSLSILSKVLRLYGGMFSQQTWGVLFKGILFPMIDSAKTDIEDQRGSYHPSENPVPSPGSSSWTSHIGKEVFTVCLDMFKIVRSVIGMNVQLLSDFLSMLEGCICQDSEALGRLGLMTLVALVEFLGEENSFFDSAVADLVCAKVSQCALRNLCVDFGASGTLRVATTGDFDWYENERKEFELLGLLRLPASNIGRCLTECPIAARRNAKVWSNDISNQPGGSTGALRAKKLRGQPSFDEIGTTVRTPYGDGTVNEKLGTEVNYAASRRLIRLDWGAILYSCENHPIVGARQQPERSSSFSAERRTAAAHRDTVADPRTSDEALMRQLKRAAMTSMVISLGMATLIGETLLPQRNQLRLRHLDQLLTTLEVQYWHARSINDDRNLRLGMKKHNLMKFPNDASRLPDLLEQEVSSLVCILDVAIGIYLESSSPAQVSQSEARKDHKAVNDDTELRAFAEPWISRTLFLVFTRYLQLERALQDSQQQSDMKQREDSFVKLSHTAYTASVLTALHGIAEFSPRQFESNCRWVLPLLSKLLLCSNRSVRVVISDIYSRKVNSIVISAIEND